MHFHTSVEKNGTTKYFQAFDFETEHISIGRYVSNQSYIPIREGNNNMSNIYYERARDFFSSFLADKCKESSSTRKRGPRERDKYEIIVSFLHCLVHHVAVS